jgi:hypothetical protein
LRNPRASQKRAHAAQVFFQEKEAWFDERMKDLEANGFAWCGDEIDAGLRAELDRAATLRVGNSEGIAVRTFCKELTPGELSSDSIFVRFALQPAVMKVACAYFGGRVPVLAGAQLVLSHGENYNGQWQESQLWHRDYNDARMLKFWVYLTDVEKEENGPFTYLPAAVSRRVPNNFFPGRVADKTIASEGLSDQIVAVYGPRLKTFYIDTGRCYHLGSRLLEGQSRFVYVATFVSHAPLYPVESGITLREGASEVERLAVVP